jgi:hypothetical protein
VSQEVTAHAHLVVGHVCIDEVAGEPPSLGGTCLFAATQALEFGCTVEIATACTDSTAALLRSRLEADGARLQRVNAASDTHFRYGLALADGPSEVGPIAPDIDVVDLSTGFLSAHMGPIINEIPIELIRSVRSAVPFVGITPQGFMRSRDSTGQLVVHDLPDYAVLELADAIVVNETEFRVLSAERLLGLSSLLFVTRGPRGAGLFHRGQEVARHQLEDAFAPLRAIGAGDVFASTAFVQLARGADPDRALRQATTAATAFVRATAPHIRNVDEL